MQVTDLPDGAVTGKANPVAVEVDGDEPAALYRFYNRDGVLLYVGITVNLAQRWEDHAAEKFWWPQVTRKTVALYGCRKDAANAERIAIAAESPLHNVAGQVPAGSKEMALKRLERRISGAERALRQTSFTLDAAFQARVDAYAKANGRTGDQAVGILLCVGLIKAEEEAAELAAIEAEIAALQEQLAAQGVDVPR